MSDGKICPLCDIEMQYELGIYSCLGCGYINSEYPEKPPEYFLYAIRIPRDKFLKVIEHKGGIKSLKPITKTATT